MKSIIVLAVILISATAQAQTLYRWTDEKGVIHITKEPPPEGIEATKDTFKPTKQDPSYTVPFRPAYQPQRKTEDPDKLERARDIQRRAIERDEQIKRDLAKKKKEQALETARREYEGLKRQEAEYREGYNNSHRESDRLYYKRKLAELEAAEKKLRELER